MYRRILVGCDGSHHARDALTFAAMVAQESGAWLILGCAAQEVPDFLSLTPRRSSRGRLQAELRDEADRVVREAQATLPSGVKSRREVVVGGSAAGALYALAEAEDVDLIVLGSSHRGVIGRVLAGSVGQQMLDSAPCAVAVAPAGFAEKSAPELGVIGVGIDGKPDSLEALLAAEALAHAAGASLRVISVIAPADLYVPQGSPPDVYDALEAGARENAHRRVEDAIASLTADVPVVREIVDGEGPIASSLEAAAEVAGLDLLVVGSRGFGPVRRVLLGSVSSDLMIASPCPLLIVPRISERSRESTTDGEDIEHSSARAR